MAFAISFFYILVVVNPENGISIFTSILRVLLHALLVKHAYQLYLVPSAFFLFLFIFCIFFLRNGNKTQTNKQRCVQSKGCVVVVLLAFHKIFNIFTDNNKKLFLFDTIYNNHFHFYPIIRSWYSGHTFSVHCMYLRNVPAASTTTTTSKNKACLGRSKAFHLVTIM